MNFQNGNCKNFWRLSGSIKIFNISLSFLLICNRHHGLVVITTAQLHSIKPKIRFCVGSNPACGVSQICNGEDLWQWSQLEIRLNTFHWSTITQKQSYFLT